MIFNCRTHWDANREAGCPSCMSSARTLLVRCFLELQEYDGHKELKNDIRAALGDAACSKCGTNGDHYCPADIASK